MNIFLVKQKTTKVFSSHLVVSSPSDLIGKIICHFTDKDDKGECTWVKAITLNIYGENSANPKFKNTMSEVYIKNSKMGRFSWAMLL